MSLYNALTKADPKKLIEAGAYSSTETGSAVDVQAYDGMALVVLNSSAGDDADATLNAKIQDSADGSTGWADITGAAFTEVDDTAGGSIQAITFDIAQAKQYIRAVGTLAGATPVFSFGVSLLAFAKYE